MTNVDQKVACCPRDRHVCALQSQVAGLAACSEVFGQDAHAGSLREGSIQRVCVNDAVMAVKSLDSQASRLKTGLAATICRSAESMLILIAISIRCTTIFARS